MQARRFLQVSVGLLALAASYHFGASSAAGQTAKGRHSPIIAATFIPEPDSHVVEMYVLTSNGDVFVNAAAFSMDDDSAHWAKGADSVGNFWTAHGDVKSEIVK